MAEQDPIDAENAGTWIGLGEAKAFLPGTVKKLEAGGHSLAVGQSSAGFFAMANACAHEGGSLGEGSLDGDQLVCPLHALKYKTDTGACAMDTRYCQKRYDVKVEGGQLLALLPVAAPKSDPATTKSSVELWKSEKHGLDGWSDILAYAKAGTPMKELSVPQMERMKWFGFFYRKTNDFDRYMTRIRIPGCAMTAAQMKAMAFIAYESGYSILDVTTRGNIQIQGLSIQKLPGVAAALEAVGLTAKQTGHDNVRNITSLPLAGIDPEELIDTRLLAEAMQAMIIDNKEFSDLPRKMNPAFCGREKAAAHVWTQDLSFVAGRMADGSVAFRLLLGGTQGQSPTLAWCAPVWVQESEVLPVTAAVLRAYSKLGWRHNRHEVRLHFLMERIGNEAFLRQVEEQLGYALTPCELPIPQAEREEIFVGWQAQKSPAEGSWQAHHWALGVCVPVGRLTWEQAKGLAALADAYGDGGIRTTLDQNLIITGIPNAQKSAAEHALAALGLSHESDSITRQVVACTGKQFCNLAIGETKGHAFWLIEELRRRRVQLHGITVHMSGCPNSCGMTLTADIGLQGTKARRNNKVVDAFDVYLGGGAASAVQLGILFKKAVPVDELPFFLQGKIAEYHEYRQGDQGFSQFWRERLSDHVAVPSDALEAWWLCTKCGYPHAGDVPPTYCPTCSAIRSKFDPAPDGFDAVAYRKGLAPGSRPAEKKAGASPQAQAATPKPAAKRLVIVGGGIAAYTAAAEARRLDPGASITLLSEETQGFYNRLNLTRFLNQELEKPALFDFGPDWLKAQKVELRGGARVTGLLPANKEIQLADGELVSYDALILAHGAAPAFPVFWRDGLQGLLALRTLKDAETLKSSVRPGSRVVVVGGGVLGVEAACGLAKAGAWVTVVEIQDRLMPRQLDAQAAQRLRERLQSLGVMAQLGAGVRELRPSAGSGQGQVEALVLSDGTVLHADVVVVSAGIQPQVSWAKAAGLSCARGIEVDDFMATSAEGVWACGDVAQWRGAVPGLWAVAQEQALVAAASALGKPKGFQGTLVLTQLKCAGVDCISLGDTSDLGAGGPVLSEDGQYRRLFTRNGLPVGAILYGTAAGLGDWRKLVEDGLALERLRSKLLPDLSLAGA